MFRVGFEDGTDIPAQVLSALICHRLVRNGSVFDGEDRAVRVLWVLSEKAAVFELGP